MNTFCLRLSLLALLALSIPLRAADVMVVYDASNSMWGQIDGRHKIEIARDVMAEVMKEWDEKTQVGLVAYGHRREADCSDIETVIPVGALDRENFIETVNAIVPRGKTPLTAAVRHAADVINFRDRPATVILISDGIESCNADPCASAADLERAGIEFTAHVIGFDVGDEADQAGLKCIADHTGGQFFAAADADGLAEALGETSRLVAEPDPEIEVPEITLFAPETAIVGSEIEIGWEGETSERDLITVIAPNRPDDDLGRYARIGDKDLIKLIMPGETGPWELRFRHQASGEIAARAEIELVGASPELVAPESVAAGAQLSFSWKGAVHPRDAILIAPAGAPDGELMDYLRVSDHEEGSLTAPGEPGEYELRYRLDSNGRILARAPFTVVEEGVSLRGPEEVATGAPFEFEWSGSIHPRDYITIVPAEAPGDARGRYTRVGDRTRNSLTAPGEPGDYELRYRLNVDGRVIARAPVRVSTTEVTLSGPEEAVAGSDIRVSWNAGVHPRDYVTVVPAETSDSESGAYSRVKDRTETTLRMPGEAGEYELR